MDTSDPRALRLALPSRPSQQTIAQRADCSLSAVRLYEAGFRLANSPTLERVLRVLADLEAQERAA
jgi:transcriptional regulator with XRE-family HTH domain